MANSKMLAIVAVAVVVIVVAAGCVVMLNNDDDVHQGVPVPGNLLRGIEDLHGGHLLKP